MSLLDELLRLDGSSATVVPDVSEVSRALQELEYPEDLKAFNWSQVAPTQGSLD
jgi:hypothetical protein